MRISIAFALSLLAASAEAETWPICFQNDVLLDPDGFRSIREATAHFKRAENFRASILMRRPGTSDIDAEKLVDRRVGEAHVEFVREGIRVDSEVDESLTDPRCLMVDVVHRRADEPPVPPTLWHLRGVYFSPGSAEIPPGNLSLRIAAAMNEPGRARYIVDGHTDTAGPTDANLVLSRRRAEAVAEGLVRHGVGWEQIDILAFGETRPARATGDGVSEPLNRRAWIDIRWAPSSPD